MRKAIQIVAGLLLAAALAFPPFRFVISGQHSSYDGFLGYYLVIHPPDNPIEIMKRIHEQEAEDKIQPPPFNHATDSIRTEVDPVRLLLEVFGIIIAAALLTAFIDRRNR